jgi:hypothetical protein
VVFKLQRKPLPKLTRKAFELCFGYKVGDQDQVWVPSICGFSCSRTLVSDGKESEGFACLSKKFPKISEAKKKDGIFIGPQIQQLFKDHDIGTELNTTERRAWEALENVCSNFSGNEKAEITMKLCRS